MKGFNTQPPEGGWGLRQLLRDADDTVSTHSRPKAAGSSAAREFKNGRFNTQPPEGGWPWYEFFSWAGTSVSTHSRPKAAGYGYMVHNGVRRSFNTQPPEGGWRLLDVVSLRKKSFNTQPPEGGWGLAIFWRINFDSFNTQPPEGGWSLSQKPCSIRFRSPDFAKLPRKARTRV
ncbi:hypothetical protein [Neisseria sicca]|uniref:hypothetical protein n=1 Tax=Neisseria sicca TaxID=490 RepID=UPI003965619B